MAATIALIHNTQDVVPSPVSGVHKACATVVFDSSYPTGGEAVDLQSDLGLPASGATIKTAKAVITAGTAAGFQTAEYDTSGELCLLYVEGGTEVPNTTDASSVTVEVSVEYTI